MELVQKAELKREDSKDQAKGLKRLDTGKMGLEKIDPSADK